MICPNCRRETPVLRLMDVGKQCDGCRNPSLDIPSNLDQSAWLLRERAKTHEMTRDCLIQEAEALEAEAAAIRRKAGVPDSALKTAVQTPGAFVFVSTGNAEQDEAHAEAFRTLNSRLCPECWNNSGGTIESVLETLPNNHRYCRKCGFRRI